MWYTGGTTALATDEEVVVIYAESTNGVDWFDFQLAVDRGSQGTCDAKGIWAPTVIKDGHLYRMWYAGSDADATFRIIYSESDDGVSWRNFQLAVDINSQGTYDSWFVDTPMVIKDGGLFKMWYTGAALPFNINIIYCESDDGIKWRNFQLAVDTGSEGIYDTNYAYRPAVISELGYGKMWYRGDDGTTSRIIYSESY